MPQKSGRKGKGKSQKEEKAPMKSQESIGVKDCLVWDRKGAPAQPPQSNQDTERETKFLAKKGELGKPTDRGYVYPEPTPRPAEDEGTVIEALRGWPGQRREQEEDMEDEDACAAEQANRSGGGGKKSGKKGKDKAGNEKGDPPMVYLVSHKYLSDFERQKMEEAEAERQKEMAKRRPAKSSGGATADIKGNKTSQLRAIHLASQTQVDPKDMWKMKKFSNAKSNIDTFRKNEKAGKKGQKAGAGGAGGGESGPCTCGLNVTSSQPVDDYVTRTYDDAYIQEDNPYRTDYTYADYNEPGMAY